MILRIKFLLLGLAVFLSTFVTVLAQDGSGACSWHGGVNCTAGWQPDGTAICKDGTKGSEVQYSDLLMCQKELTLDTILTAVDFAYNNHTYIQPEKSTLNWDVVQDQCEREMYQNARYVERSKNCIDYTNNVIKNAQLNPTCPSNSEKFRSGPGLDNVHCRCVEGYYNYPVDSYNDQGYCSQGEAPMTHEERMMMLRQEIENEITNINKRATEKVRAELNFNPLPSDIPEKQLVRLADNVKDPDVLCEEGYVISSDGVCTYVAKKVNSSDNSTPIATTSQSEALTTVHDRKSTDKIVWLIFYISIILISANGLRLYFNSTTKKSE